MNKGQDFIRTFRRLFPDDIVSAQSFYEKLSKLSSVEYDRLIKETNDLSGTELCPLCYEPIDNGEKHGSWCK